MRRRRIVAGLALSAVFASACAGPDDERQVTPVADANLALTPRWWYLVGGSNDSATESRSAATTAEKEAILARIRELKATKCPGSSECRVALTALVCAPSLGVNDYCSTSLIASHIGWQATVDTFATFQREQITFLEQRRVPARWIDETLRYQRGYQNTVLADVMEAGVAVEAERSRVVNQTRSRLNAMAISVRGEETVRLADLRWIMGDISAATGAYESGLARARPLYADVAQRFTAYRATEASVIGELQQLATQASAAQLTDMAPFKLALERISGDENRVPQQLIIDADRARWELAQVQAQYDRAVDPHGDVIAAEGLARLDHTTVPRDGMGKVVRYAEQRIDRVNAAVREILEGIERREEALVLVAADAATRDAARAAAGAHAEAAFLDDITTRITEMWRTLPASTRLRLPLLGERVSVMQTFLQLEKLCAGSLDLASWRGPGCTRVANELAKVRRYLTQTLPFTIRIGIGKLRTAGVTEAELAAIEADLVAGRTTSAVHRYDIAVRAVEEG